MFNFMLLFAIVAAKYTVLKTYNIKYNSRFGFVIKSDPVQYYENSRSAEILLHLFCACFSSSDITNTVNAFPVTKTIRELVELCSNDKLILKFFNTGIQFI